VKTRNQIGSAHVVIIVLLTVAVLGLLGFVFWQNFMGVKTSDTTKTETANKVFTEKDFQTGLTLEYPNSWTATSETDGDLADLTTTSSELIKIRSDASDAFVTMSLGRNIQMTGGCIVDGTQSTAADTKRSTLPEYARTGFASFVIVKSDGMAGFYAGTLDPETSIAATLCSQTGRYFETSVDGVYATVYINSTFDPTQDRTVGEVQEFLSSNDYKTAKKIVESLHVTSSGE